MATCIAFNFAFNANKLHKYLSIIKRTYRCIFIIYTADKSKEEKGKLYNVREKKIIRSGFLKSIT